MNAPLVSVILPAYNAADTIHRATDSILSGAWKKLELVVVDDGSTDATVEIVRSLNDDRVRLISQEHRGVAQAMNTGVSEGRGSLIARMDADDFSRPYRLQQQVQLLQAENLDIVGGLVRIVDGHGVSVHSMQRYERWVNGCLTHEQILAQRFIESPLVHPTTLARREIFELGCREGDFPEDYDLWLRALQAGCRAGKVSEVVLDWTDGNTRLTRTNERYSMAAFDRCRREHLLLGPLENQRHCNLWGAGETGKDWLRWLKSKDFQVDFVVEVSPKKIGKRIHDVEVIGFGQLPPANGAPILIAVGAEGAREKIQPVLLDRGYTIGGDAWFVA